MTLRARLALAVTLATLAAVPALAAPWDEDEVFLFGAVRGLSPWMNGPLDAYRFSSGEPAEVAARVATGAFPWYVAPDFKYALFRPLASALLWLDATAFGGSRLGPQLHALAWHAALVVAGGLLLGRALPRVTSALALFLFATSVAHTTPTAWLTARHVLVGGTPALFACIMHVYAAERRGPRAARWLAPALVLLGLLGSEAAAQAVGYVVAYEITRTAEPLRTRARRLAPIALVGAAYAALYVALGRGHAYGSALAASLGTLFTVGLPRAFVHAAVLLGVSLRPDNAWGYDALRPTVLVVVPIVALAIASVRRMAPDARRDAAWLALGAALAIVPALGAPLESRVLVAPSLGASGVVAIALAEGARATAALRASRRARSLVVVLLALPVAFVHLILAPIELPLHYVAIARERDARFGAFVRATKAKGERDLLVVGAPHFLFGQLGGFLREQATGVREGRWVPLADANCAHRVTRPAPDRLEITPRCPPGFFPYGRPDVGDEVQQLGRSIRVLAASPELRFEVHFPRAVEDAGVELVSFEGFADRRVRPPGVGETLELPAPAPPELLGLDGPTRWLHARFDP